MKKRTDVKKNNTCATPRILDLSATDIVLWGYLKAKVDDTSCWRPLT
jgi:hypothetical protein